MKELLINGVFPLSVENPRFWLGLAICIIVPYRCAERCAECFSRADALSA